MSVVSCSARVTRCVLLLLFVRICIAESNQRLQSILQDHLELLHENPSVPAVASRWDPLNKLGRAFSLHSKDPAKQSIVVPAGSNKQLANAYVCARVIRELGCSLPIEIAVYGPKERPDTYHSKLLEEMRGVRVIDLQDTKSTYSYKPDFIATGFAIKVLALIYSQYDEVLLIDADSLPLISPQSLFGSLSYKQHGNMFWSDINTNPLAPIVYETFNLTVPWSGKAKETFFAAESGQIMLNRKRYAKVLFWLWFVTANNDWFYSHMHGDKDTYRLAFALAGQAEDYYQISSGPRIGLMPWKREDGFFYNGAGFVQTTSDNKLAFYHRVESGSKLNPSSVLQVTAEFVTTPVHQSWTRGGMIYRDLQHGGDGPVSHYPPTLVDAQSFETCCQAQHYKSCTSCPLASPVTHNQLLAIPVSYFPRLRRVCTIANDIFVEYQHKLWRHAWDTEHASSVADGSSA